MNNLIRYVASNILAWFNFIWFSSFLIITISLILFDYGDLNLLDTVFPLIFYLFTFRLIGYLNFKLVGDARLIPWEEYEKVHLKNELAEKEAEKNIIKDGLAKKKKFEAAQKARIAKKNQQKKLNEDKIIAKQKWNKEIEIASKKPFLGLVDSVIIAKEVIEGIDSSEIESYRDFLDSIKFREFLISFNNDLYSQYDDLVRRFVLKKYFKSTKNLEPHILDARLTADISECMKLGLKNLMKNYSQEDMNLPVSIPRKKIKKTHSWEDLKDDF